MKCLERRCPNGNLGAPGQKSGARLSDQLPRIWYDFLPFLFIPENLVELESPCLPLICSVYAILVFVYLRCMDTGHGGPGTLVFEQSPH